MYILFLNIESHRLFNPLGNTTDTLSPAHTVLWLPPYHIRAQPCPRFLRPHGPLATSISYSSSTLSVPSHRPAGLPPDPFSSTLLCKMVFALTTCPNHLISGSVHISKCALQVHDGRRRCTAPAKVFCSNCFQMSGCVSVNLC